MKELHVEENRKLKNGRWKKNGGCFHIHSGEITVGQRGKELGVFERNLEGLDLRPNRKPVFCNIKPNWFGYWVRKSPKFLINGNFRAKLWDKVFYWSHSQVSARSSRIESSFKSFILWSMKAIPPWNIC